MGPMVDSVKLIAGRRTLTATSAARLREADASMLVGAAKAIATNGAPDAAMGLRLPSGNHAVLRRIGGGDEVRGLILETAPSREAILHMTADARLWSSTTFTLARRVPLEPHPGNSPAPVSWTLRFRTSPAGFAPIDGGAAPQPSVATSSAALSEGGGIERPAHSSLHQHASTHVHESASPASHGAAPQCSEPDPYSRWALVTCGLLTMSAMLFLAIATIISGPSGSVAHRPSAELPRASEEPGGIAAPTNTTIPARPNP